MAQELPNVRLEPNGNYWRARYINARGRRCSRNLGPISKIGKRKAQAMCRELALELSTQPDAMLVGPSHMTIAALVERICSQATDHATQTLRAWRHSGDYLCQYFGADCKINKLTEANASEWRAWLHSNKQLSESSIRKHISKAKTIFERARKQKLIATNPFAHEVSSPLQLDDEFATVDMATTRVLLDACPDVYWRGAVGLARYAGLRINEIVRAQREWINHDDHTIQITAKGRKKTTKARRRITPIRPELYPLLVDMASELPGDTGPLVRPQYSWGWGSPNHALAKIIRQAGLEPWPKVWHALRKNCESEWISEYPIADVCKWLGNSPAVAMRYYHMPSRRLLSEVTGIKLPQSSPKITLARDSNSL